MLREHLGIPEANREKVTKFAHRYFSLPIVWCWNSPLRNGLIGRNVFTNRYERILKKYIQQRLLGPDLGHHDGFAGETGESAVVLDDSPADDCEGAKFLHNIFRFYKSLFEYKKRETFVSLFCLLFNFIDCDHIVFADCDGKFSTLLIGYCTSTFCC